MENKEEKTSIRISKKGKTILGIICTCAVFITCYFIAIKPYIERRQVTNLVSDIANEYSIDLKCINLKDYPEDYRFSSEAFGTLDNEDKMNVLMAIRKKLHDNYFLFSNLHGYYTKVVSKGTTYWITKHLDIWDDYEFTNGDLYSNYDSTSQFLYAMNGSARTGEIIGVYQAVANRPADFLSSDDLEKMDTALDTLDNYNKESSDIGSKTATCKSCGRSFEAGDSDGNFMNIARTGMCNNCYKNYQWGQKQLGK